MEDGEDACGNMISSQHKLPKLPNGNTGTNGELCEDSDVARNYAHAQTMATRVS